MACPGQKHFYVPAISLKFQALFDNFHFSLDETFSDGGGWMGQAGLASAPNEPVG